MAPCACPVVMPSVASSSSWGWMGRHFGRPTFEGEDTIAVAQIIGTAHRGRDFDGCWRPTEPRLARRLEEIASADPAGLDEPIEVVRVDRAYFVVDGHKRVALANRTRREFLDARVDGRARVRRMTCSCP